MLQSYRLKNHSLYLEYFYSSLTLGDILIINKIYLTGMINLLKNEKQKLEKIFEDSEYAYISTNRSIDMVRINNNKKKKNSYLFTNKF